MTGRSSRDRSAHRKDRSTRDPTTVKIGAMPQTDACGTRVDAYVCVDLDGTRHHLRWPRDKTLVDAMLDAGVDPPHSCREGHCGSCVATVVSGEVDMATCEILEPDDLAEGLILGCQARPVSDDLHVEY